MINLEEQFSPRVNPADANYPFGSIKDNTSPGANDGTPLAAVWGNDWEGFAQAAMTEAGITPSGLPDTAQDSQLLAAVKVVASGALRPSVIEALRRSYAEAGYNLVDGSFEAGGTLVNVNDVLLQERTGKAFSGPAGTVAAGTDPTSGGFTDQSGNIVANFSSYTAIRAYAGGAFKINLSGRSNVFDKAHGVFVRDGSDATSADDDGMILVDALGRRWKRQHLGEVHPEWFGAKADGVNDDTIATKKAVAKAYELFLPVKCLGGTYLLTDVIELLEPFKFKGNGSKFIINHAGDGFHVKSSTNAKKSNINSLKDMNFLNSATPPSSFIKIGVASVLEPTNIELNGIHFKKTVATTAHIINERSYGLKINSSAFSDVHGTCALFRGGIGSDESVYTYQCSINQIDITGCDYGIVVEGGRVQMRDGIIESCRQRAVWSKGISFNPSIFMDNIYFENNTYSLYFEAQQNQGYTLNSELKNCVFRSNSVKNFFSANNKIRLSNNRGWNFNTVEGSGRFSLAGSLSTMSYNPTTCPDSLITLESPYKAELGSVSGNARKAVPFFNLRKMNGGRINTAMKVTIVRETGNIVTYYQAILQATDVNGMTWRTIQIASQDAGGIVAAPTFEKNPLDAADMNLYFYYPNTSTVIITVEGEGGFG